MAPKVDEDVRAARRIIDANSYLTLATADAAGRPWATPVWFAHDRYSDYLWVSRPGTRHSANIAVRPETAIVVFDSTVPVGDGRGVYIEAHAEQVPNARVESVLAIFSAALETDGGCGWQVAAVAGSAPFRLYMARASAHHLLDAHDHRVPVDLRTP
ncbi:MAG: pyridoxamine 5'-phosphate oxidase family protein [Candidatus Limnocylindria bacterium]